MEIRAAEGLFPPQITAMKYWNKKLLLLAVEVLLDQYIESPEGRACLNDLAVATKGWPVQKTAAASKIVEQV